MSPPQEGSSYRQVPLYASDSKRMRISTTGRSPGSSTTTRASTGAPTAMTNKGSVYKAQRGKAVTAAAVKSKAPTTHRRRGRKGKSVYRGVCVTREGKWRAVIYKERKQLYLGVYESEVDAAKAHDRAARFHFAENAVCNFESEHEADRQSLLQKERLLLQQQQQLVDDRPSEHAQLHAGEFAVGREEFDDLEEYHRGLDEASSEEGEAVEEEDESSYESCTPRSSRSFSTSSSASIGSMSDDYQSREDPGAPPVQQQYEQGFGRVAAATPSTTAGMARAAGCGTTMGASLQCDLNLPVVGGARMPGVIEVVGNGVGYSDAAGTTSGDSDSDFTPVSTLLQDLEPTPLEGMDFPFAEDLLGYEMRTWYNGQDERSAAYQLDPLTHPSFVGVRHSDRGLVDSSGWGFADLGHSGRQSSTSSMSSGSLSCDDDFMPSALPPLLGMSADT